MPLTSIFTYWLKPVCNGEGVLCHTTKGEKEIIGTPEKLLDSIESEEIYQLLITTDRVTLKIVVLRLQGLSYREIASKIALTEKEVYLRIARLKGKLKATIK